MPRSGSASNASSRRPRYAAYTRNAGMPDSVTAILLAAGSSSRMEGVDKLWADLGGKPLVAWSLRTLAGLDVVTTLVVVAPVERHQAVRDMLQEVPPVHVVCVEGGARRQDS